jgi:hypothetical protein
LGLAQHFAPVKALAEAIDDSRLAEAATTAMRQTKTEVAFAAAGEASGEEGAAEAIAAEEVKGTSSTSRFSLSVFILLQPGHNTLPKQSVSLIIAHSKLFRSSVRCG